MSVGPIGGSRHELFGVDGDEAPAAGAAPEETAAAAPRRRGVRSAVDREIDALIKAYKRELAAEGQTLEPDAEALMRRELKADPRTRAELTRELEAMAALRGATAGTRPLIPLGHLDKPGSELRDKTLNLLPGQRLRFTADESAVRGLGEIKVRPAGAVTIERKVVRAAPRGMAGGSSRVEYTISVPPDARAGTAKLTTAGHYQTRNNPDWAFKFAIRIG